MTYIQDRSKVVSFVEPELFERSPHERWPFKNDICELQPRSYSLVMIDCAWTFKLRSKLGEKKSAQAHYACMSIQDIAALPVSDLAHPEGCLFWVWGTAPMMDQQLDIVRRDWGLKFITSGVWVKTTVNNKINFGPGYVLRGCHEPFYLCTVPGDKIDYASHSVRSVLMSQIREHSRKPEDAYDLARRLIPHGRAADVFTRERRPTWEPFGDQIDKFTCVDTGELQTTGA